MWTEAEVRDMFKNKPDMLKIVEAQLNAPQTHTRRVLDLASGVSQEFRGFSSPKTIPSGIILTSHNQGDPAPIITRQPRSRKPRVPLTLEQLKHKFEVAKNRLEMPNVREKHHQITLFLWSRIQAQENPRLWMLRFLHGDGSGDFRSPKVAREMVAQGGGDGFPDIVLLYPARGFHGLTVELKIAGGSEHPKQKEWRIFLISSGYKSATLYGWEAVRDFILWYLGEL
jgi:VRR-NUC domain